MWPNIIVRAPAFFAFSFLALSPRGIVRSANGRSAEGGVRSELEPLRAEPRSAIARAGACAPPRTYHEQPPLVGASLNIYIYIYLSSFQTCLLTLKFFFAATD